MTEQKQKMNRHETAAFCEELALLLHAGVSVGDGLALMEQEQALPGRELLLKEMSLDADDGYPLHVILKNSELFPDYVIGLTEVGVRTGRLEEALTALASYYEGRERMENRIRSSLLYPSILLVLMFVVIVVLLAKVLPVFQEVYASLGGQLNGLAGGLYQVGLVLDRLLPLLCLLLFAVLVFLILFSSVDTVREKVIAAWQKRLGDQGVSRKLNDAKLAGAMAMGLSSGLPLEEAMDLAAGLVPESPGAMTRIKSCRDLMDDGQPLAEAMREAQVLPASCCRLLALGMRSGNGDQTMVSLAERLSEEADAALERMAAQVEPVLVLVTSGLVGVILLSVMLPLMHIMSTIG